MTHLCVSLTEPDTTATLEAMRDLPPEVELVELRLDAMESCRLEALLAGRDRPVIVTNRPEREGGACRQEESERLATLRRAAELGAEYVDVELDAAAQLGELPAATRRIVSCHNFQQTPADLEAILQRIRETGADVAKLAVMANDMRDVTPVLDLLRRRAPDGPLIALSMGEPGIPTRVLAGKFGAFLTYASRTAGREAAPGQVPVGEMLSMYRLPQLGPETAVYGVAANPVGHSMSPAVHNAAFAALGLDAVYLPFLVTDPAAFLRDFERFGLRGLSVTIPHKETMMELMDEVDETARRVGALNTVHIRDGHRYGCNTDVRAAVEAIREAAARAGMEPLEGRRVLMVGAGGAGRAIAGGLRREGVDLVIANRTVSRGEALGRDVGAAWCSLQEMERLRPEIIVNTTSVGMWPRTDRTPVPAKMLREDLVVFDSVYNPPRTRLLREAEEAGATTAGGLDWFVNQAAAQFELWTDRPAPREVMRGALEEGLVSPRRHGEHRERQ
ncbi:MAG: shikimate dehydrogenase [Candidatus Brocadiia bacterium]